MKNHNKGLLPTIVVLLLVAGVAIVSVTGRILSENKAKNPYNLTLKSIERSHDLVKAEFCFNLPSDAKWELETPIDLGYTTDYPLKLITDKDTFEAVTYHFTENESAMKKGDVRCEFIHFQPPDSIDLSGSKIIVKMIVIPIPFDVKLDCDKAQQRLDKVHPGVVIGCDTSGNSTSYWIAGAPKNISPNQAYEYIHNAIHENIVYGPWTFSTGLKGKGK